MKNEAIGHAGWGMLLALTLPVMAAGSDGRAVLTGNDAVLAQWAQASGAPAPRIIASEGGSTRLEWRTSIAYDYYQTDSRGGFTLTPVRDGNAGNTAQLQTEFLSTGPDNSQSWFTFGITASDDRAVLGHPTLINTLQIGHAGEDYRVALGDVPVNFSTLGANTGLRGLLGERYIGRTLVQAVAGVQTDTWESLAKEERRTRYIRNSYAFKAEHPVTETLSMFVTTQGFSDNDDVQSAVATSLATAEGRATTAGLSFQRGRFTLGAEGGFSDWEEEGLENETDDAWIVDAGWQGDRVGVQFGHHDIGLYYTSLSGDALSGVRETYGNASWLATNWLSLNSDLRHTVNERASLPPVVTPPGETPYTPNAYRADSWSLGADVAVLAVDGLNLQLSHSGSDGENEGGGKNDQDHTGLNLQYGRGGWSTGLGYQRGDLENSATPDSDAETRTWSCFLGRQWTEAESGLWSIGTNASYNHQRQSLDAGTRTSNDNYSLSLNGQHVRWGQFTVLWYDGRVRDPATGQNLDHTGIQFEAGRQLGRYGSAKVYYSKNDSFQGNAAISYEERTLGLQFLSTF